MPAFTFAPTDAEKQSGFDRVKWAEGLIRQLPTNHDGRNTWLMNYGVSDDAEALRKTRGRTWNDVTRAARI